MARKTDPNDVYRRMQTQYDFKRHDISQSSVLEFLTGKDRTESLGMRIFAQDVENLAVRDISLEVDRADTLEEFEALEDTKIPKVRELIKTRRENVEKDLVDAIKTETNVNDFEKAVDELRELNPRRLGGIRSGDTRRAKAGFKVMFQ